MLETKSIRFNRSKKGVVSRIYHSQRSHSKERNHPLPTYTQKELESWMSSQSIFHDLYNEWVFSGYKTKLKPSIDRLDDKKPYSMSNIRIITFDENRAKSHIDGKNGLLQKNRRHVTKSDMNYTPICSYISLNEASRDTGLRISCISNTCHGRQKSSGGFRWEFAN